MIFLDIMHDEKTINIVMIMGYLLSEGQGPIL